MSPTRIFVQWASALGLCAALAYPAMARAATLIAHYNFNACNWPASGVANDGVGGHDGVVSQIVTQDMSPTSGLKPETCSSARFAGGTIDVTGLPVSTANGAKTSVSFWMYWDGTNSVMPIGWRLYDLWLFGGSFGFNTGNGDIYGIASSGLANGWHHIAAVFSNRNVHANELYVDGVKQTLTQRRRSPNNRRAVVDPHLRLSGWWWNNRYRFRGRLDEVKVYNGALNQAEVDADRTVVAASCPNCPPPPPPPPATLIAAYNFDDDWATSGVLTDTVGGANGAVSGAVASIPAPASGAKGDTCNAADFNGGAIDITGLAVSTTPGDKTSISFWMNWDGTNSVMPIGWRIYDLWLFGGSFGFNTGAGDIYGIASNGLANGWHHIAVVFTNGDVRANEMYVDGVKQTLTQRRSSPRTGNAVVASHLRISGWWLTNGYRFHGAIDSLKVYTGTLDQSGVLADMAAANGCATLAEYHLDESRWSGAAGEVIDSSGNGHNGTALGGITTATTNPAIGGNPGTCGYGVVPGNSSASPAQAVDTGLNPGAEFGGRFTISFWHNFQNLGGLPGWHVLFDATPTGSSNFFLLAHIGTRTLFLVRNAFGYGILFPNITAFTPNGWHYFTASYDVGSRRIRLYFDAVLQQQARLPSGALAATRSLVFGDGVSGNAVLNGSADGLFDEIRIYQLELTRAQIQADMLRTRPCGATVDHFKIVHDGFGINCAAENIDISARDASDAVVTGYTGTVTIDTGSGKGDWSLNTGNGILNNGIANDGQATYTFAAADNGVATLALDYQQGASPITLALTDGTATDDGSHGPLVFSPSGFTVTANALANPPPNPINDPIGNQTAGTDFTLHISAFGQTPTDPVCGIIESYTGNKTPKFWSTYLDPGTGTVQATVNARPIATAEGSSVAQAVTFSNGQASVAAKYKDVGRIRIELKDDTVADPNLPAGIRGASNSLVVKPDHFRLSGIRRSADGTANPGAADANGPAFIRAGAPFTATVTAYDAENSATPNYGRENSPETVRLTPTLVAPAGGANPALTGSFNAFSGGSATGTSFAWGEVGIISLTPSVGDTDYLGAGDVSGRISGNIGRFTPFDFNAVPAATPEFGTTCGAFSYMDQPFQYTTAPVIKVTARNQSGATTTNYRGAFWKITDAKLASAGSKTYTASAGSLDLSLVPDPDPVIVDTGATTGTGKGTGTLTFSVGSGIAFARSAPVLPFDAEIALSINVIDSDDVGYPSNPFSFGAASPGNGIAFSGAKQMRWGRLRLTNSVGSELLPLPVPLQVEYFDAGGFVPNGDDGCTTIAAGTPLLNGDLVMSNLNESNQRDGDIRITPSATSNATIANSPLVAGDAGLVLSAPGAGATGYADLTVDLSTRPWLQFDWDGDGNHDNDPGARATFGIFSGNPHLIFSREPWN